MGLQRFSGNIILPELIKAPVTHSHIQISAALRPLLADSLLECVTDTLGGSYRYKGQWEQIDHIYLSRSLLSNDNSLHLSSRGPWVDVHNLLVEPELLYGGYRPKRTYNGMRYIGGTSDHLPVCFDLEYSWDNY